MKILLLLLPLQLFASEQFIDEMCKRYKAKNCNAVKAISWVESNFKHVINKNDNGSPSYGIMQVKCIAARQAGMKYDCEQLNDKKVAMRFGIKFLDQKLNKFSNLEEALAAYNSNRPIRCKHYNAGKCYPEELINHNYVYKAMRRYNYQVYKQIIRE